MPTTATTTVVDHHNWTPEPKAKNDTINTSDNDAASDQMTKSHSTSSSSSSFRARARWAILRQALLSQPQQQQRPTLTAAEQKSILEHQPADASSQIISDRNVVSIHRFPGFQMMARQPLLLYSNLRLRLPLVLVKQLQQYVAPDILSNENTTDVVDWIEAAMLALHCCDEGQAQQLDVNVHPLGWDESNARRWLQEPLKERGIACCIDRDSILHLSLALSMDRPDANKAAFAYHLPAISEASCNSSPLQVVTREPDHSINNATTATTTTTRPRLDLTQLASQRYYNGIDNTGNICVWDSSRTCAWVIIKSSYKHESIAPVCSHLGINTLWDLATAVDTTEAEAAMNNSQRGCLKVMELGAGMAGLPCLTLAALHRDLSGKVELPNLHVTITDGHPNAVRNNRVNALLTLSSFSVVKQVEDDAPTILVDCRQLLWSKEPPSSDHALTNRQNQDLVLACDCTHFEEYHEEFLMTMLSNLRVGGVALLCQPPRGQSLSRFLSRVEQCQRMEIQFVEIPELIQRHEYWMQHQTKQQQDQTNLCDQAWYDPSIHCPQIVLLRRIL
jgi:hypothetical protein